MVAAGERRGSDSVIGRCRGELAGERRESEEGREGVNRGNQLVRFNV